MLTALLPFPDENYVRLQKHEKGEIIPLEAVEWH